MKNMRRREQKTIFWTYKMFKVSLKEEEVCTDTHTHTENAKNDKVSSE